MKYQVGYAIDVIRPQSWMTSQWDEAEIRCRKQIQVTDNKTPYVTVGVYLQAAGLPALQQGLGYIMNISDILLANENMKDLVKGLTSPFATCMSQTGSACKIEWSPSATVGGRTNPANCIAF
jgi:hypothetical protein